jgi:hypothetical protein
MQSDIRGNPASIRVFHINRLTKEAAMTSNEPDPGDLPPLAYSTRVVDPWNYRPDPGLDGPEVFFLIGWSTQRNLVGYHVKAADGNIGKVETASHAQDESYLVVDTGPWIFGSTLVVPAGLVSIIDHSERNVYLICTKELVKSAPAYEPEHGKFSDQADRDKLADYYRAELSP